MEGSIRGLAVKRREQKGHAHTRSASQVVKETEEQCQDQPVYIPAAGMGRDQVACVNPLKGKTVLNPAGQDLWGPASWSAQLGLAF